MEKEESRMSEPFVSNIISAKYDTALDFHVTMYDKLPYQRDSDYCNAEKLALISGRVIKYYLYCNQPEKFLIDNKDDVIDEILANAAIEEKKYHLQKAGSAASITNKEQVTPEQIQTLLDDQENASFDDAGNGYDDDDELAAPANAVNAFEDVEDW